ncbi:10783_t:CDS:2 [Scutellospora calospora]|uniref:10783_t:CDS:1 n=1 Tax=Scutellospora calospora TaxID=85575 RepID=A0ACA9KF96_9GLOM|nr:10783_t:CDS:2 [Scutellospora calospora]
MAIFQRLSRAWKMSSTFKFSLAFDHEGNKLDHRNGVSYYDKYWKKCQTWAKPPITMALALDGQILKDDNVPVTDNDRNPDLILSPYQDIRIRI